MLNFCKESLKLGEMQRGKNFLRWQVGPSSDNTTEPLNTASQQRHRSLRTILPEIFFNCTILELYDLHSLTISNHGSQKGPRQAQVGQGGRRQGTSQTPTDNRWTFTDFLLDIWHEKCTIAALIPKFPKYSHALQKKGSVAQKQIKVIQAASASSKSAEQKKKDAEKLQRQKEKEAAELAKKEAAELFKPIQVQKVPFGVDPKTVLCQFFKAGNCEKGS